MISILALMAFIVAFPAEALEAAGESAQLWLNRAMPSLLPFMICINMLSAAGFTEILGGWLAGFMKLFGVPGVGGFALAAGMLSGYPVGAKVTAQLRETGALKSAEAQRLISFANNSGPLFILGTVGVGMFGSKNIGYFLMFAHYSSALITGLLFRSYKGEANIVNENIMPQRQYVSNVASISNPNVTGKRQHPEQKPFGTIVSQSVANAMESMAMIGGFIIFFGVMCKCAQLTPHVGKGVSSAAAGVLEMTNGLYLSQTSGLPVKMRVLAAAAMISFGGMSIHAQSISMFGKTGIKISIYLLSKLVHAIIALAISFAFYPIFMPG